MTSVGDPLKPYLLAVRGAHAGGMALGDALTMVPAALREQVRARWTADRVVVEPVGVLTTTGGPRPWFDDYDPAEGYHWTRLREFLLLHKQRSESVIESLDTSTDRILSMLEDPRPGGPAVFDVRGLVIGHVQSGKTANFSALIAKSVDAGYRIVIVLSGLHNSLRRQTQLRLEDELGLVDPTPQRPAVGRAEAGREIFKMTGAETWQDFHAGTADAALLQSNRVIFIVKKNASVLRRLVGWFEELPKIAAPVLVIDDEADQASINTGGNRPPLDEVLDLVDDDVDGGTRSIRAQDETDPSVINGLIRRLLNHMHRRAYVGYTATPFANVLIDRDAVDRVAGSDLYPADFIVSLPRSPGYVGTEELFGRDALTGDENEVEPLDVIRRVPDYEADLLADHHTAAGAGLPSTLEEALLDFVLAMAARDTRTGESPAAAMLVHASMRTDPQLALADEIRTSLASLRQGWRYGNEPGQARFRERWETEFRPVTAATGEEERPDLSFDDIEPALHRNFRYELPVMVLNTKTNDELDYQRNPNLRAVVVGGNKLSRGLTIEGLLVSYYVRPASYYDTLLQMGRWFGYRKPYVDLTRLWITDELRTRFRDLATAEEALRREIRLYDVLKLTPRDFAPRILAHDHMGVTSPSHMGSANEISADYSADLVQTINFELRRRDRLTDNLEAVRTFLSALGPPQAADDLPTWADVSWRHIVEFLGNYRTMPGVARVDSQLIREYVHTQASRYRELTRWTVSVRGRRNRDDRLGDEDLGITGGNRVNCIERSREAQSETSIRSLVNPASIKTRGGDEEIGLRPEDITIARTLAGENEGVKYGLTLRNQRDPDTGLLLIYPISRHSRPDKPSELRQNLFDNVDRDGQTVIGMAVVFPPSESPATYRYVVGSTGTHP